MGEIWTYRVSQSVFSGGFQSRVFLFAIAGVLSHVSPTVLLLLLLAPPKTPRTKQSIKHGNMCGML